MVNIFFTVLIVIGGIVGLNVFNGHFPAEQRGFGFRAPESPVMEQIMSLHGYMLIMVFVIPAFVLGLMAWIFYRYSQKKNPVPSNTTHNTKLEIIWTTIPVLILIAIAIPSVKLLYFMDKAVDAEMTLKVVGYQWYWGYEYPDNGGIAFESVMIPDNEIKEGQVRLLETDNRIVLPVETNIRVLVTSTDVIHAWAMQELGVKIDAVPGKLNETWLRINKPGIYRGQCSELCGVNHAFMPIVIEAVSKEDFQKWTVEAKQKFAGGYSPLILANN